MYGKDGKTTEISLRNKTDNFEKGHEDKFKVSVVFLLHFVLKKITCMRYYDRASLNVGFL